MVPTLALTALLEGNRHQLSLLLRVLGAMDERMYAQPLPLLEGGWIGRHVRHVLDGYLCLLLALETGTVDYERRSRDPRTETDRHAAMALTEEVLRRLDAPLEDRSLRLSTTQNKEVLQIPTRLSRELLYVAEHSIHHFALIRLAVRSHSFELPIPSEFGIAPSTLRFANGRPSGGWYATTSE